MVIDAAARHTVGHRPEPGMRPEQLVARAEAMVPALIERQGATDERSHYSLSTHEEFSRAGFYRILVPRRYGGLELGIDTFLQVSMALSRGCPSTGWMFTLGAAHALAVATLLGERAQEELFATGEFICPATVVPAGSARRAESGDGWVIDGIWAYCSGAPYATHFLGHTLIGGEDGEPPRPMLFVVPRSRWRRLDDWGDQLGLKGSGSHSIVLEDAYVPDHHTLDTHLGLVSVTDGTPGLRLHGNPLYGGGQMSFMQLEGAALAVGMAKGALDAYEELMRSRTTTFPPIVPRTENADYQYWYGQAAGMIATAEAAITDTIRRWGDTAATGPAGFTGEWELRAGAICHQVLALCWGAVERYLVPTAGSSAVRNGARVERIWRDMSMQHTHAGYAVFLAAIAPRELARARFGIDSGLHA
jgi:3-hydroxy-9,10-secoandrosta-1,3,5(10)-triene-9,17-dione monooxygenase